MDTWTAYLLCYGRFYILLNCLFRYWYQKFWFGFADYIRFLHFIYNFFIHQQYYGCGLCVICQKKIFLEIIKNISEVDNKILYPLQEKTYMNRKLMFNIFSKITLVTVVLCGIITLIILHFLSESFNIIFIQTISCATYICIMLIVFQFVNLVLMMEQWDSHLNKFLTKWINGTVSRTKILEKEKEWPSNPIVLFFM